MIKHETIDKIANEYYLPGPTNLREALSKAWDAAKLTIETREQKAARLVVESGKTTHASDCATSIAPAEEPGPCDCEEII